MEKTSKKPERRQYCFHCGEDIGPYFALSSVFDTCGRPDCEREARYSQRADEAQAREQAEADHYSRYK